jgi:hypothetical protein
MKWFKAVAQPEGYNDEALADLVVRKTKAIDPSRRIDEVAPPDFLLPSLFAVACSGDRVLDFGGGGGLQYLAAMQAFPRRRLRWAIDKEQLDALGFHTSVSLNGLVVASNTAEALQGGPRVTLLSAAPAITDAGTNTLASATIKIANGSGAAVAGDQLYVNGVQNGSVGSGVTASWNASNDILTLTGSAALSVYSALLGEVGYTDTGMDASSGSHPALTSPGVSTTGPRATARRQW